MLVGEPVAKKENQNKKENGKREQLEKELAELKKRMAEIESELSEIENSEEGDSGEEELPEIENPYTVTNRAISELVSPKDTMFYLTGKEMMLVLTAYEIARIPEYFGEPAVNELSWFADKLKHYLVSKNGRGRRDLLRLLRVSSGQVRENVNKSLFRQLLEAGRDKDDTEEE